MVQVFTFLGGEAVLILYHTTGVKPALRDFTDEKIFSTALVAALAARRQEAAAAPPVRRPTGPRPSRDTERLPETIATVIPAGHKLCVDHWYRIVCSMTRGSHMNSNRKRSILAVARAIHLTHDKGTGIFMAGVKILVALARLGKATVNRALATLRQWNLLTTVAEGRSIHCTENKKQNDRAVWALLAPVDKTETPGKAVPPEAAEDSPKPLQSWATFARKACGSGEYKPLPRDQRDVPLWHGHETTSSIKDEALATRELQRRLYLALGKASHTHLQAAITPLLRSGHTLKQIIHMIDHRPDGSPWPHDGAAGVRNVIAWIRNRVNPWISKAVKA